MKRMLSLALAVLLLAGCGAAPQSGAGSQRGADSQSEEDFQRGVDPVKTSRVLTEPVYPEFPQKPQPPKDGSREERDIYTEAYDKYIIALMAIRGKEYNLTDGEHAALNAFAARSTSLAVAGHEGENAVYSPLSLWSALAMLAQCAGGDSRQQVLDALGTDSVEELRETVSHLWQTLYTDDGQSSLILGNSIWLNGSLGGSYVQETLDALAQQYYAGAYTVPMGTDEADQAVTDWVSQQTNGLIGGEEPVVQTEEETLALLASSLYFRAAWLSVFDAERTKEDIFTDAAGQESRVDFMHKTEKSTGFLRREGWQAAGLNTELGEMIFVLPDEGVTPESLLQDPEFLNGLNFGPDSGYIWGEVRWSVPKFDVDSDLDLKEALAALGITDLLAPGKADLSALTDLDAFLSDAKQLSRVKVDEEGVEAAAVTLLGVALTAMPPEDPEICVMDLDRPFLFVIRTQDVPLFIGIVNQV